MTATGWIILAGCVVFNLISGYFFFTEKQLQLETMVDTQKKLPKSMLMYAGICFLINIGIALLLHLYYEQSSTIFVWKRLSLLSILWAVGYIDFKTYKIPNRFIVLGLSYRAIILVLELLIENESLVTNLLSEGVSAIALVIASVLCSLCVKNSIGFGDIKLFIVMGLLLGFNSIWSAVFVSLIVTFLVAVTLLLMRKKTRKDAIPFAPLLMVGTYISIILTGM